jgi:hypothetical protein
MQAAAEVGKPATPSKLYHFVTHITMQAKQFLSLF